MRSRTISSARVVNSSSPDPPGDSVPEILDAFDASHLDDHDTGDWEMNDITIDSPERWQSASGPPRSFSSASSDRTSPSLDYEKSAQGTSTKYHPLINGGLHIYFLRDVLTSVHR